MSTNSCHYDIIVVGAGHAGIEAALAAARLGCRTAIITASLDWIGNMPCNPSIGGSSKGQIVRELSALGAEMPHAADACAMQCRMLNLGKGPAVHAPRAQIDRRAYSDYMKAALEAQPGLAIKQAEVTGVARCTGGTRGTGDAVTFLKKSNQKTFDLENSNAENSEAIKEPRGASNAFLSAFLEEKSLWRIETRTGTAYTAKRVILATGTFLRGRVHFGTSNYESGPDGMPPSIQLSEALQALGIPLRRFKTGTPPRVHMRSVDISKTTVQPGDAEAVPFSFDAQAPPRPGGQCYLTYTTEETKRIILANLDRSPLYGGVIEGIGPRYCPSIEDKMVRFPDKERHPIFIEPCGDNTQEMYLQGASSSLPEDVQEAVLHSIPGLEHCEIMRLGYAIEYDCTDPLALRPTLEFMDLPGLYGAGQFNGSSGYEEAAAQGFMAGVNAAHSILGKPSFVLRRSEAYIGTLIDDLITKGCNEPYRMMTSRAEYRLLLRHDTADRRLTPYGYQLGLISQERWQAYLYKQEQIEAEKQRVQHTHFPPSPELNAALEQAGSTAISGRVSMPELLRRPQVNYALLAPFDTARPALPPEVITNVETDIKYEGYLKRQQAQVHEMNRLEDVPLPPDMDYTAIPSLRLEAREKLSAIRPETLGQAARISGVNPADVTVLLLSLKRK